MTEPANFLQPRIEPGIATAEAGLVILDGPDGVAITMTADAAAQTGLSLISAAQIATQQIADRGGNGDA